MNQSTTLIVSRQLKFFQCILESQSHPAGKQALHPNSPTPVKMPHLSCSHLPVFGLGLSKPFLSLFLSKYLLNCVVVTASSTSFGSSFHTCEKS